MIDLCRFFLPLKIIFGSGNFSGMIIGTNAIPANILRGIYLIAIAGYMLQGDVSL